MKRYHLKMGVVAASLIACASLMLSVNEPDAYTPYNFIYDRQSRPVADYLLAVLGRGDAATLRPALQAIHTEIKAGTHDSELDVMRVNLTTLISTAEDLIQGQQSPDKTPFPAEELPDRTKQAFADFEAQALQGEDAQIVESKELDYAPPEHDSVYNEAKKDLLDEAYDMLETIDNRKK